MNPDFGQGQEIADLIKAFLKIIAEAAHLEFKTPPHDIAAWVVNELKKKR